MLLLLRGEDLGHEKLRQQRVADVVDPERALVALFGQPRRRRGDPGVEEQPVQTGALAVELRCALLHAFQGCEIELEDFQARVRVGLVDLLDEFFPIGWAPYTDVDLGGVVLDQFFDYGCTYTGIACEFL